MQSYEIQRIISKYEHLRGLKHFYEWSLTHLSDSIVASEASLGRVNSSLYIFEGSISLEEAKEIKAHYQALYDKTAKRWEHNRCGECVGKHYDPFCFYNRYMAWADTLIEAKSLIVESNRLGTDTKRIENDE